VVSFFRKGKAEVKNLVFFQSFPQPYFFNYPESVLGFFLSVPHLTRQIFSIAQE